MNERKYFICQSTGNNDTILSKDVIDLIPLGIAKYFSLTQYSQTLYTDTSSILLPMQF